MNLNIDEIEELLFNVINNSLGALEVIINLITKSDDSYKPIDLILFLKELNIKGDDLYTLYQEKGNSDNLVFSLLLRSAMKGFYKIEDLTKYKTNNKHDLDDESTLTIRHIIKRLLLSEIKY